MCFSCASLQALAEKETIAGAASKCVEDLSTTVSGRFLLQNLRISEYSDSKDAWKKHVTQHKRKRDNFLKEMEIDEEFLPKVSQGIDGGSVVDVQNSVGAEVETVHMNVDGGEKKEVGHVDVRSGKKKRKGMASGKEVSVKGSKKQRRKVGNDASASVVGKSQKKGKKERKRVKTKSKNKIRS